MLSGGYFETPSTVLRTMAQPPSAVSGVVVGGGISMLAVCGARLRCAVGGRGRAKGRCGRALIHTVECPAIVIDSGVRLYPT